MTRNPESPELPNPPFWPDLLPVAEDAFGVWSDTAPAVAWGLRAWRVLNEAGLVPDDRTGSTRNHAVALVTLLALANVYRDFCQAAFEEPSSLASVAYAAERARVPDAAIARLAGEHLPEFDHYESVFEMIQDLVRVAAAGHR